MIRYRPTHPLATVGPLTGAVLLLLAVLPPALPAAAQAPTQAAQAAGAPQRSLLFSAAERRRLACAQTRRVATADGDGGSRVEAARSAREEAVGPPARMAHLSSLVYAAPDAWSFRVNGRLGEPGRLPPDIAAARVQADNVTLVRVDPTTGTRQSLRLRVGERRAWPVIPQTAGGDGAPGAVVAHSPHGRTDGGTIPPPAVTGDPWTESAPLGEDCP
ncbi:MAG: hypothetical protein RLY86_206 [Pseudomonadota bacterium]|jgi:hypothetical protein